MTTEPEERTGTAAGATDPPSDPSPAEAPRPAGAAAGRTPNPGPTSGDGAPRRSPSGFPWLDGTGPSSAPRRPPFRITATTAPGRTVVAVAGELDMATVAHVDQTLQDVLAGAAADTQLMVDLADLTFIDSHGVVALVTAAAHARARSVHLEVLNCRPAVLRVLDLTRTRVILVPEAP